MGLIESLKNKISKGSVEKTKSPEKTSPKVEGRPKIDAPPKADKTTPKVDKPKLNQWGGRAGTFEVSKEYLNKTKTEQIQKKKIDNPPSIDARERERTR